MNSLAREAVLKVACTFFTYAALAMLANSDCRVILVIEALHDLSPVHNVELSGGARRWPVKRRRPFSDVRSNEQLAASR